MKNATEHAKALRTLIDKHKPAGKVEQITDPLEQLVYAFLLWESTRKQADTAYQKLKKTFVDDNELRVSDPTEIVEAIGKRYPRAEERAIRLRDTLHAIYLNEYAVTLDHLADRPKRQARQYLSALEGIPPFVAARVVLLALGGHAIPVDEALATRLKADDAADPEAGLEEIQAYLEKQIRSNEAASAHQALLNYVEATPAPAKSRAAGGRSGAAGRRANPGGNSRSAKTAKPSRTSSNSKSGK